MISIATDLTAVNSELTNIKSQVDNFNGNLFNVPVCHAGEITIAEVNVFQNLLSITGEGFLKTAIVGSSSTYISKIKVTIDGVLKVFVKGAGGEFSGIGQYFDLLGTSGDANAEVQIIRESNIIQNSVAFPVLDYPTTVETKGIILLAKPIEFKTSLLIEITYSIAGACPYVYEVVTK